MNFNLPLPSVIAQHITRTRTYNTDDLFAGNAVPTNERGYGTEIHLEAGVRSAVLTELTQRVALNNKALKEWNAAFDAAVELI